METPPIHESIMKKTTSDSAPPPSSAPKWYYPLPHDDHVVWIHACLGRRENGACAGRRIVSKKRHLPAKISRQKATSPGKNDPRNWGQSRHGRFRVNANLVESIKWVSLPLTRPTGALHGKGNFCSEQMCCLVT